MALDNNAGSRRAVSALRNLQPEATPLVQPPTEVKKEIIDTPSYARAVAQETKSSDSNIEKANDRYFKVSFHTSKKLTERFRRARLKGGFETLEDAYNEAIERFCNDVDAGKIDRF